MEVIICKDYDEMSKVAAEIVRQEILRKPSLVLGLATGSTPLGLYKELIRMHKEEGLDFSQVVTFNLDEYYPIRPDHEQSYHTFMFENLFNHINIPRENIHIPKGWLPPDQVEEYCEWYEQHIKEHGGIDVQILGIGANGHIAFNEPGSSLGSRTRLKTLDARTIKDNSRFFRSEEEVPRWAITMGVGTIMEARKVLLLANGEHKADAIAKAVEGPVTSMVPASMLQLHPRAIVIVDEPAASKLQRKEYYIHVQEMKRQLKEVAKLFEREAVTASG